MKDNNSDIFFTECFVKAIMLLIKEKPFSEISVTELCGKARISRMTFYRNFSSREDVFYKYTDWIVEKYKREIVRDKGFASYIRLEYIKLIFDYFKEYSELVVCMVENHLDDHLRKTFVQTELNLTLNSDFDQKSRYTAVAYANALYGVLIDWLCSGDTDSDEPANVVFQIFSEQIKRY